LNRKTSARIEWPLRLVARRSAWCLARSAAPKIRAAYLPIGPVLTRSQEIASRGFTGPWSLARAQPAQRIKQCRAVTPKRSHLLILGSLSDRADLGGGASAANSGKKPGSTVSVYCAMVPNHMGIDSSWLIDRPDWFVGLDYTYLWHTFDVRTFVPNDALEYTLRTIIFRDRRSVVFNWLPPIQWRYITW
jgi:hypothetical protein